MIFVYTVGGYYFCIGTRSLIAVFTEVQASIKHNGIIRHKDANTVTCVIYYTIQYFLFYFNGNFSAAATKASSVPYPYKFNSTSTATW
jgi:hypothetical protein